ncbi:uncharacterized protein [Diadema setosum]|uniref:uncharacterized protein n=1 Tax=Diadema setosum TaxID=31175 RepID=UPI003B3AEC2E
MVSAIEQYIEPASVKDLERFLGLLGWYQEFIPGFDDLAAPMYRLKLKNVHWEWTEECSAAFRSLKDALTREPVLGYPDRQAPFVVHIDASDFLRVLQEADEEWLAHVLYDDQGHLGVSHCQNWYPSHLHGNHFHVIARGLFSPKAVRVGTQEDVGDPI